MECKYRVVIVLKWFTNKSCIQLMWHNLRLQKLHSLSYKKFLKSMQNLLCEKCQKSCYFCGRILSRILCSWKVYEVFHVCHPSYKFVLFFFKVRDDKFDPTHSHLFSWCNSFCSYSFKTSMFCDWMNNVDEIRCCLWYII